MLVSLMSRLPGEPWKQRCQVAEKNLAGKLDAIAFMEELAKDVVADKISLENIHDELRRRLSKHGIQVAPQGFKTT